MSSRENEGRETEGVGESNTEMFVANAEQGSEALSRGHGAVKFVSGFCFLKTGGLTVREAGAKSMRG